MRSENKVYQGEAGAIDCSVSWPTDTPRGWALVLHPHPEQGGTRDNKVVTTIARACAQAGLVAVRPNFRGVGKSAGSFDQGEGETADMRALVRQFSLEYPELVAGHWVLGGFSFGTSVGAHLYSILSDEEQRVPDTVILAGPAVQRFRFRPLTLPDDTLLIHGEEDDVVPLSETMDYAREAGLPVVVVPGAGHFFHGRLLTLRALVEQRLRCI